MASESPDPSEFLSDPLQDLKERIAFLEDRYAREEEEKAYTLQKEDIMKYCSFFSLSVLLFIIVSIVDVNYVFFFFIFAMFLFRDEKK